VTYAGAVKSSTILMVKLDEFMIKLTIIGIGPARLGQLSPGRVDFSPRVAVSTAYDGGREHAPGVVNQKFV
jgi:hypothetical protein